MLLLSLPHPFVIFVDAARLYIMCKSLYFDHGRRNAQIRLTAIYRDSDKVASRNTNRDSGTFIVPLYNH